MGAYCKSFRCGTKTEETLIMASGRGFFLLIIIFAGSMFKFCRDVPVNKTFL